MAILIFLHTFFYMADVERQSIYTFKDNFMEKLFHIERNFENLEKVPGTIVIVVGQIEGKNLRYRGTIPFCLHIVP